MAWLRGINENKNTSLNILKALKKIGSSVDGGELKTLLFNVVTYKFLSLRFEDFLKGKKEEVVEELGYGINSEDLFSSLIKRINQDNALDLLKAVFERINESTQSSRYPDRLEGLFNLNFINTQHINYNKAICIVFEAINGINFGEDIDNLGDFYSTFSQLCFNRGSKEGGEYFTPTDLATLMSRLSLKAGNNERSIKSVYDPACGSGSLLIRLEKEIKNKEVNLALYGQEINPTTGNLARVNMVINKKSINDFNIFIGDTLRDDKLERNKVDVVISNPPFSLYGEGNKNPDNLVDKRFEAGIAPTTCADGAFIQTGLFHLKEDGVMVVLCYPSILIRKKEEKIREGVLDNNWLEAVIHVPEKLFFTTSNDFILLVFKKKREERPIIFIEASQEAIKAPRKGKLDEDSINRIVEGYKNPESADPEKVYLLSREKIKENNCKFGPKEFKINSHAIRRCGYDKHMWSNKNLGEEWRWIR